MATKTLILRPTSVTYDDESLVTLYPSDTVMADAHMLVNEEIADDDATYISGVLGSVVSYSFNYIEPNDMMSITSIRCVVRYKLESGTKNCGLTLTCLDSTIGGTLSYTGINTSTYTDTEYNINENGLTTANYLLVDEVSSIAIVLKQTINSNSSKGNPMRTTQVYLEITYEASEPSVIYLNKNGQWNQNEYTSVYQKNNGLWELTDLLVLSNDQKYIIKEVE